MYLFDPNNVAPMQSANDGAQDVHRCMDCGVDLSNLRRDALRCEPCRKVKARARASLHYYENRAQKLDYNRNRRQDPVAKEKERAWTRRNRDKRNRRQREKHRAKTGYNPEGRTCEKCGADIPEDRGHRAKWCEACSTPAPRECTFCHTNISHRGARARFCNEECRRLYHQWKEMLGYNKVCTKCHETKEHTEFGFHNNLRRSLCKLCEVESQSVRYNNFTPEQRSRRRHVRRRNEEIKRARMSPDEKIRLRAKRLKANRLRKYGVDGETLYLVQEGRCAICAIPMKPEAMHVDHDHSTKRTRGLLCKNCNMKLLPRYERFPEHLQDSPRLNAYLARGKPQ